MLAIAGAAAAAVCAVLQFGSDGLLHGGAARASVPAHISEALGERTYREVGAVVPLGFVRLELARAALARGDEAAARAYLSTLRPSGERFRLEAEVARREHRQDAAVALWLRAADLRALDDEVARLRRAGRPEEALALLQRVSARLQSDLTHPDALAESYWRSAVVETQLKRFGAAYADYERAAALAPFSTKYSLAAGVLALKLNDIAGARAAFARSAAADPASGDAYAGLGMTELAGGNRERARADAARSRALDPRSRLLARLEAALQ